MCNLIATCKRAASGEEVLEYKKRRKAGICFGVEEGGHQKNYVIFIIRVVHVTLLHKRAQFYRRLGKQIHAKIIIAMNLPPRGKWKVCRSLFREGKQQSLSFCKFVVCCTRWRDSLGCSLAWMWVNWLWRININLTCLLPFPFQAPVVPPAGANIREMRTGNVYTTRSRCPGRRCVFLRIVQWRYFNFQ